MPQAMIILLWLFSATHTQASLPDDGAGEWVRTFWLTPSSKPNMKLFVVRDSEEVFGFCAQTMPDGTYKNYVFERNLDMPFEGNESLFLGIKAKQEGIFTKKDSIKKFRMQLRKFGAITKELNGPATVEVDSLWDLYRYATKYPNHVKVK